MSSCAGKYIDEFWSDDSKNQITKGISQEKFADMCDLHRTYISDIELGKRNVSLENIEKMSVALNLKISQLFEEVEKNEAI